MEIGMFSPAMGKQALHWDLNATVCAGLHSELHASHVDSV